MANLKELERIRHTDELTEMIKALMKRCSTDELSICFTIDGDFVDRVTKKKLRPNHTKLMLIKDIKKHYDCTNLSKSTITYVVEFFMKAMLKASKLSWEKNLFPNSMEVEVVKKDYI